MITNIKTLKGITKVIPFLFKQIMFYGYKL